jgi:DNA-directed RNA polymerase II subunit RPB2
MERDAILAHGVADFMRESLMKRSDGYDTWICDGCGTIPIYNEKEKLYICSMCDGPVRYIGDSATTLEILPPNKRSAATFSKVEIPYAFKLLDQELNTFYNMGLRLLTDKNVKKMEPAPLKELAADQVQGLLQQELPTYIIPEEQDAEIIEEQEPIIPNVDVYDLSKLGALTKEEEEAEGNLGDMGGPSGSIIPVAVAPVGAVATNAVNLPTVVLQQPMVAQQQQQQQFLAPIEQDMTEGEQMQMAAPPIQQMGGGMMPIQQPPPQPVQVQTSQQPVLVVPVNVGGGAPMASPAEYVNTYVPGAPSLLAVDTSPQAMASTGLPPLPSGSSRSISFSREGGGGGGGFHRPSSGGGSGRNSRSSSGGGGSYDGPSAKITVNKLG